MPQCEHCGSYVSHEYARVLGNNNDEVERCLDCSTMSETKA